MNAKSLMKKHDPENYGEFDNDCYWDMYSYATDLEKEIKLLKKTGLSFDQLAEIKNVIVDVIDDRINKLEHDLNNYGEDSLLSKSFSVQIQKLSNLQTEICIALDKTFENM